MSQIYILLQGTLLFFLLLALVSCSRMLGLLLKPLYFTFVCHSGRRPTRPCPDPGRARRSPGAGTVQKWYGTALVVVSDLVGEPLRRALCLGRAPALAFAPRALVPLARGLGLLASFARPESSARPPLLRVGCRQVPTAYAQLQCSAQHQQATAEFYKNL